uniref:Uncharacterized protein n=1 Tax=Parascaris univalens TaxID=6257 RepID=A0A915A7K6_PARUN
MRINRWKEDSKVQETIRYVLGLVLGIKAERGTYDFIFTNPVHSDILDTLSRFEFRGGFDLISFWGCIVFHPNVSLFYIFPHYYLEAVRN